MANETNYPHRDNNTVLPRNSEFYTMFDVGDQTVINSGYGGQYTFAPNNFRYVNEHPYITQRPYCNVLSTPKAFDGLPNPELFHRTIRNFMETRSQSWQGMTARTQVEYVEIPWAGGSVLSVPAGATRQFGSMTHNGIDQAGEETSRCFDAWIEYLLKDPVIQQAKIITLGYPGDLLIDEISMASVYWEPTRNFTDVARACLVLAQMPKEGVNYEMAYDSQSNAGKLRELSFEFTGLYEWNTKAAKDIARTFMKRMPLYNPTGVGAPEGFKQESAALQALPDNGTIKLMEAEAKKVLVPNYMQ